MIETIARIQIYALANYCRNFRANFTHSIWTDKGNSSQHTREWIWIIFLHIFRLVDFCVEIIIICCCWFLRVFCVFVCPLSSVNAFYIHSTDDRHIADLHTFSLSTQRACHQIHVNTPNMEHVKFFSFVSIWMHNLVELRKRCTQLQTSEKYNKLKEFMRSCENRACGVYVRYHLTRK